MSLNLDTAALRERFVEEWDADRTVTTYANGDPVDPDEAEPFVRFAISPGNRALTYGGEIYSQLGRVWLQIFVPKGEGDALAYELADDFTSIFRGWRSDDGCLRMGDVDVMSIPSGENGNYQVNVSIQWESMRRL